MYEQDEVNVNATVSADAQTETSETYETDSEAAAEPTPEPEPEPATDTQDPPAAAAATWDESGAVSLAPTPDRWAGIDPGVREYIEHRITERLADLSLAELKP